MTQVSVVDNDSTLLDMLQELRKIAYEPAADLPASLNENLLKGLVKEAMENARRTVLDPEFTSYAPMWVVVMGNNNIVPVMTPFVGDEGKSKDTARRLIRMILQVTQAKAFCFTSEAWVRVVNESQKEDHNPQRPISSYEDKKEVIFVTAESAEGETLNGYYEIIRDWETGKVKDLIEQSGGMQSAQMSGRFANLFD